MFRFPMLPDFVQAGLLIRTFWTIENLCIIVVLRVVMTSQVGASSERQRLAATIFRGLLASKETVAL